MRTIEYGTTTTHVPAFLTKLWKLVTDASCADLISWSLAGTSFIIYDEIRFSKELLPMYFKHNNMASFVRQLNMYGFRKLSCIDQGGMHCYKNEIEFYHQYFLKGQETLLELIKRKIPNSKSDEPKVKQEYVEELISNIKTLKGKTDCAEQGMRHLRRENRMLWRHVNLLTDRYSKQQSVLQQLLPFFVNMVRSSHEITLKRKATLMIDEGDTHNKIARMSPPYYVHEDSNSGMPSSPGNVTNRGPVIHDVTEMESSKMFPATILCPPNTTTSKECEVIVDSPLSCSLERSEQAIDSPFTEPASMETLNILNQNFERRGRSNSLNAHMEMRRSPINTSNSSLRMSSPCSMPGSSRPSFTLVSSGIPPTVIIDETTSDVPVSPISDRLMRSPFAPKIENACTDSGLYTMGSMINDRVSSAINEETVSMLNEGSTMMGGRTLPLINDGASASSGNKFAQNDYMSRSRSNSLNTLMEMRRPSISASNSSLRMSSPCSIPGASNSGSSFTSVSSGIPPTVIIDETTSDVPVSPISDRLMRSPFAPKIEDTCTDSGLYTMGSMISDRVSSAINEETVSMLNEGSTMMGGGDLPLITDGASASSGNKFAQNDFMSNVKSDLPEMNWLMNQTEPLYGSEPNFENWLGQIFKSDNLTPGCSLPQPQQQEQLGNVNFVQ